MNSETRASRRELAAREAAEWLLELRQGALGAAHREELVDWLRESPLNVAEFLRVARVSHTLDGFQGWDRLPDSAPGVADNIIELTRDPAAARGLDSDRRPVVRPRRHQFAWAAAAAGGAAAAVAAVWLFHFTTGATLRTAAGERREVTLADGSIVSLAPASEVRVRFASTERDLWLLRGEAFFRVHKNPQRPFIVEVNGNRVRAVGTAFGVRREQADAVVTVVEGVVSVSAGQAPSLPVGQAPAAAPLLLGANQQLRIPNDGTPPSVKVINGSIEVAWTAGELIFDDEVLSDVVRRFNAHNRLQIVIMDSALAARRVSGVFRASDPESFVAFIQAAGGVPAPPTARRDGDRIYVGEAAPASK